jgi:hypothetical protein
MSTALRIGPCAAQPAAPLSARRACRDARTQTAVSKILGGGATSSEEAKQKRALAEVKGAYAELQRQQSSTEAKAEDYRLKLKDCRAALALKEKQLETSQLLLQRMQEEKQQIQVRARPAARQAAPCRVGAGPQLLRRPASTRGARCAQASAAADKAQARKMKIKLDSDDYKNLPELQDKYRQLKKQAGGCWPPAWRMRWRPACAGAPGAQPAAGRAALRSASPHPALAADAAPGPRRPCAARLPARRRTRCSSG